MVTSVDYPIHLGLAYLFLGGYISSRFFRAVNLPGAVGIIVNGFIFSHFIQLDLLQGRDHLQSLAFFLVLLTAGFEISMDELRVVTFIFALVPVTLELLGITAFAVWVMHYTAIEGLVLGTTLCCLGDGLVIPKMVEFKNCEDFEDLRLPRLVFTWAPLEASYVLTLFGVIQGLAEPAEQETSSLSTLVTANVLRLVATLAFGACLGYMAARVITKERDRWTVPKAKDVLAKIPVLHGYIPMESQESLVESGSREETGDDLLFVGRQGGAASVEAYLLILSVALLGFGLGATEGMTLIPMPFSAGSMFQPELLVIVIGACFSHFAERFDEEVAEELLEEDLEELKLEHSKQVDELNMKIEKQIHDAPSKKEEFERIRNEKRTILDETLEKDKEEAMNVDWNPETVEGVMSVVGGVWIFGQLVLFSMLGSKTDVSVFQQIFAVLPIMIVGKTCRMLGVVAATYSTINFRVCESGTDRCNCKEVNLETWRSDALFCFLSTLPRATIQGALGPIPVRDRFFHSDQFRGERTQFIAAAARLYVVFMAVVGSILLDRYGVRELQKVSAVTNGAKRCQKSHQEETEKWEERKSTARRSSIYQLAFENNSLAQRFSNASMSPSSQVQVSKDGLSGSQSQNRRGTMKQAVEAETEEPEEESEEDEVGAVSEGAQPTQPSVPRRGTIKQQVPIDEEDESEADAKEPKEPPDAPTEATPEAPPTDTQEHVERPRVDTTQSIQSIQSTRERGGTTDSTPSRREGKKVTFGTQEQMELQRIAAQVEDEDEPKEAATLPSTASEGPTVRTMPVPSTARQSMGAPRQSTFLRRASIASSGRHSGPPSRKMSLFNLEGKQKRPQKHSSASNATVETEQEGSDEEYDGGMHVSLQEIRPELRRQLASAAGRPGRGVRQEYMPVSQD